jgi:hypothetical protein
MLPEGVRDKQSAVQVQGGGGRSDPKTERHTDAQWLWVLQRAPAYTSDSTGDLPSVPTCLVAPLIKHDNMLLVEGLNQ